ncbi:MAG TPA: YrhK family protein [Alphaproteobacteria bacterium]|nr:YrhK family protein [Alphaproteobacteria bacterium]
MPPKKFHQILRKFFDDFEWIHITLGLIGNLTFFIGSILFFYQDLQNAGIWLFVIGSFLMLIGSVGSGLVRYAERKKKQDNSKSPYKNMG